ncbi:complement factor H-like isoform X1 [Lepisosteus oculatus]|uniref:complement factor H-like isoform X1 n=1 Tax=Lepisosteus oculatus TaxID=7918 RepID=UPI003721CAE6
MKLKFILTLWIFIFAVVLVEGCDNPPDMENAFIPEENKKAVYDNGDVVKYQCHAGFISRGSVQYKCVNDVWERVGFRTCQPKPCGHPGDTLNAAFRLIKGTDFVFGSTVQYICNEGYQMASRISTRNCRENGWDNDLPHCEVVTCVPEELTEGVTSNVGSDPVTYGGVIQFQCNLPNSKLDGSEEIFCTANGQWSSKFPKCIEITCDAPTLTHGTILNDQPTYRNNDDLRYNCDKGYKPLERPIAKCTKRGWSPQPQCQEVTCEKPVNSDFGDYSKSIYHVGEQAILKCQSGYKTITNTRSVTLTCTDNWTSETKGWSMNPYCYPITCQRPRGKGLRVKEVDSWGVYPRAVFNYDQEIVYFCDSGYKPETHQRAKCKFDGFEPEPICHEIVCDLPIIENGRVTEKAKTQYKHNQVLNYRCDSNFEPERPQRLTCGKNGWDKLPSCTAKHGMCTKPNLPNGYFSSKKEVYDNGSNVLYACSPKYKPSTEGWWGTIQCISGQWSETPQCIPEDSCATLPTVRNAKVKDNKSSFFPHGSLVHYECLEPFEFEKESFATCIEGKWKVPNCILRVKVCETPPRVEHAVIMEPFQRFYRDGSRVEFRCEETYEIKVEYMFCEKGKWSQKPQCILQTKPCDEPPYVDNAISPPRQSVYENGSKVEYKCRTNYKIKGDKDVFCENGQWSQIPECTLQTKLCDAPPHVEHAKIITPLLDEYRDGSQVEYSCEETYEIQGQKLIFCEKGRWSQVPECIRSTDIHSNDDNCGEPPALLNGDTISERPQNNVYKHGDKVKYQCTRFYKISGSSEITCQQGQWTKLPTCHRPCIIPTPIDDRYNLKNPRNTEYVEEGMKFRFYCKDNFVYYDSWNNYYYSVSVLCINGDIEYPTCERYRRY